MAMQIQEQRPVVYEYTLEFRPGPRWALVALAALYLGLPKVAATGENWGRSSPEGGSNLHPIPSGVVTKLLVTGGADQGAAVVPGSVGWPPSVVLGRTGVGIGSPQSAVVLAPLKLDGTASGSMVGIGTAVSGSPGPQFPLHIKGHVRGAQCVWIGSSPRCAGDWQ